MKKWNCLFAAVILTLSFLLTGCGGQEKEPVRQASSEELHHVKINVKDYGTIAVELDSSAAPITVENFIGLAKEGFYDGLTFHRIIKGFMIQAETPKETVPEALIRPLKVSFPKTGWIIP